MAPGPDSAAKGGRPGGPIVFAYDGSQLSQFAIEQAGGQLEHGREALVVCVWQPAEVGFVPVDGEHLHAAAANEVCAAAEKVAAHGALLAEQAGFRAQGLAIEEAPTWKGIVKIADEHGAGLIVIGSHRRSGLVGHLAGSVAAATVAHFQHSLLLVHPPC